MTTGPLQRLALLLGLAATMSGPASAAPRKVWVSIDDPFVAGSTAMRVWQDARDGHAPLLPEVRLELGDRVIFEGRLEISGSPKSHLYFAMHDVAVRDDETIVTLRFSVPSRGLRWERRVDLRRGRSFILTEGKNSEPVALEQLSAPRFYL